jgi:hypothetical protein
VGDASLGLVVELDRERDQRVGEQRKQGQRQAELGAEVGGVTRSVGRAGHAIERTGPEPEGQRVRGSTSGCQPRGAGAEHACRERRASVAAIRLGRAVLA